jgi:hypothetical protein
VSYPKIIAQKHGGEYWMIAVDARNAIVASERKGVRFAPMSIGSITGHSAYWEEADDDPDLRARLMALPVEPVDPAFPPPTDPPTRPQA